MAFGYVSKFMSEDGKDFLVRRQQFNKLVRKDDGTVRQGEGVGTECVSSTKNDFVYESFLGRKSAADESIDLAPAFRCKASGLQGDFIEESESGFGGAVQDVLRRHPRKRHR